MPALSPTAARIGTALAGLLVVSAVPVASASAQPPATLAESLWVATEVPIAACPGGYRLAADPVRTEPTKGELALTATILETEGDGRGTASGDVAVRQGQRLLTTAHFAFDRASGIGRSPGPVRLREPGLALQGRQASVSVAAEARRAQLTDAEFVLVEPQLRGTAARAERGPRELRLAAPTLTRCPPGSNAWRLDADRVRVERDAGAATVRGARLRLGGVPVFYSPYLRLPLGDRRASGWLFPNLGSSSDGFDLRLPYYLNLAPNYDATLAGRWIGDRGAGLEGEFRHLGGRSESVLQGAFLARDEGYDGTVSRTAFEAGRANRSEAIAAPFGPADRWLLAARHRGSFGRLATRVDFTGVSDNDYFVDLGTDLAATGRLLLDRRAEARYERGELLARLALQDFQRLEPGAAPYRRLPDASVAYGGALLGPSTWHVGGSWTAFERPGGAPGPAGSRLHLEPQVRLPLVRSWGFLDLAARARYTTYALRDLAPGNERRPSRRIGAAAVDGGLFLERPRAGGGLQVLEPRLQYRYQSYADQRALPRFDTGRLTPSYRLLFRGDRFAGLDRLGDANELAVGVTTRLLDAAGQERFAAAIGTVAYFAAPRVTFDDAPAAQRVHTSVVASEVAGRFGRWRLTGAMAWDPHASRTDVAGLDLRYQRGAARLINIGYRRRMRNMGQPLAHTDFSFRWPLTRQWHAFARWNHDWRQGRAIETLAGIGYASCCLDVKLLWHDTVDAPRNRPVEDPPRDRGILVQFVFRGLAGFGGNVDGRLARSIRGYRADR